jgi:di/tricarboxylate transporter
MRPLAKRLLMIFCTLALITGSTISFAASVTALSPCAHEHAERGDAVPAHHDHHCAGCLACCLGACSTAVGLPPPSFNSAAVFSATSVSYWETAVAFSGRSIAPDPGPPRTIA